ncbi:hypothetical protein [Haloarchaeobius sp. DFWS5]|uniref:hypothetical protein n=1 Tax=Haloarchaeobius sp. DFWS5 TaxID=3446114 RepID=UPI003EB6EE43
MTQLQTTNPVLAMLSSGETAYVGNEGGSLIVGCQCGTGTGERAGWSVFTGHPAVRSVSAGAA